MLMDDNERGQAMSRNVELEQTIMRLFLVTCGLIYGVKVASWGVFGDEYLTPVVMLGYLYVIFSLGSVLHVYFHPGGNRWRHSVYMSFDILVTTIVMYEFGRYGAPFFVFYLWLTVGNGFRYGYKELVLCAGLSLSGFLFVCLTGQYWRDEYLLSITGIMLLSVVPLYFAIMLKRLQKEKEKAEAANREKTRFLANVSHEIRTPLNAVVGFSSILDKVKNKSEQERAIRHIQDASSSLMALVEGVLDFSRIESGHVEIKSEAVNLRKLLQSVEGMFSIQADEKKLQYVTEIDSNLPEYITGDVYRIRQILVNLIGNAIKFTAKGMVTVRVGRAGSSGADEHILFEVIDTGEGIPEEMHSKIFEQFRQADDSVQRRYGGAGLGTAISKRLVELMQGEIGLESSVGNGSRFWFRIPLVETQNKSAGDILNERLQTRIEAYGRPFKILVADDSEINRLVMKKMLSQDGVDTDFAESGIETLRKLRLKDYDVLILDIQMPGMSGFQVIEEYRRELNGSHGIPTIVVTGEATGEVQDECDRLSVAGLLLKPVDYDRLRYTISGIISVGEGLPAPSTA